MLHQWTLLRSLWLHLQPIPRAYLLLMVAWKKFPSHSHPMTWYECYSLNPPCLHTIYIFSTNFSLFLWKHTLNSAPNPLSIIIPIWAIQTRRVCWDWINFPHKMLCFGFVAETVLIPYQCFGYHWAVLAEHHGFPFLPTDSVVSEMRVGRDYIRES